MGVRGGGVIITTGARLLFAEATQPVGNTVKNTTTETAITSSYNFPANSIKPGDVYYIMGSGFYSTALVAPSFQGKFKLAGTTFLDTGNLATLIGSLTDVGFNYTGQLVVQSDGVSIDAQGQANFSTGLGTSLQQVIRNTGTITVDPTVANILTATCKWGTASATNSITHRQMMIWKVTA